MDNTDLSESDNLDAGEIITSDEELESDNIVPDTKPRWSYRFLRIVVVWILFFWPVALSYFTHININNCYPKGLIVFVSLLLTIGFGEILLIGWLCYMLTLRQAFYGGIAFLILAGCLYLLPLFFLFPNVFLQFYSFPIVSVILLLVAYGLSFFMIELTREQRSFFPIPVIIMISIGLLIFHSIHSTTFSEP